MSTIATDVMVKVQIMRQPNGFQASIYDLSKHTKITLHAYNNTKKNRHNCINDLKIQLIIEVV